MQKSKLQNSLTLAVDLMGGDVPPEVIFDAALDAASFLVSQSHNIHYLLFATPEKVALFSGRIQTSPLSSFFSFESAPDVIEMHEKPLEAVKRKPFSSLVRAVRAVRDKRVDSLISCSNTGALVAASALLLKQEKALCEHLSSQASSRPALATFLPTMKKPLCVLDVGANVAVKTADLIHFAYLGANFYAQKFQKARPRLALLNIGAEQEKGTKELQEAYHFLKELHNPPFEFVGNREGRDLFFGDVDVLVTGGFAGNIFLKTAEGVSEFVFAKAEERLGGNVAELQHLSDALSYEAMQGAYVLGVSGCVIKCHGASSQRAIYNAILGACHFITATP